MAFFVGAGIIGIVALYDDHSRYSEYDRHSRYGDSALREQISNKEQQISGKESEITNLQLASKEKFNSYLEKIVSSHRKELGSLNGVNPDNAMDKVKKELRNNLEYEMRQEKSELQQIDSMIAQINNLALQSKEMSTVKANTSVPDLEMKTATITHTYTEEKLRERDPEDVWENLRFFLAKK
ncbi:MAG: hypothetical protein K6G55_05440 [Selenomonadaceae bacterium]|nr:hypothetical protein [Selenomonadaceae bacterium]